nr:hypothetical protein [Candidatus Omnitrophota bacterium]
MVYDREASATKIRYNGDMNSISALVLTYVSNQIVDSDRMKMARYFIPFIKDVALNPSSLGQTLTARGSRSTL